MASLPIPTEYEEQCALIGWLELKGLHFSKIAQDTFTKSWGVKRKNYNSGLRKGIPDLLIFISKEKSRYDAPRLVFIELKRVKGGVVSAEQAEWIERLNLIPGVDAYVCRGFDEARKALEDYIK